MNGFPIRPEDLYFNTPAKLLFIAVIVVGLVAFVKRVIYLIKMVKTGMPENRFDNPGKRILNVLKYVFGQRRLLNLTYIGSAHFMIFWGFVIISFGTLAFLGRGIIDGFRLPIIETVFEAPFLFLLDIFSVLVIVGIIMALLRRLFFSPEKLSNHIEGFVLLGLIFLLIASDLIGDGLYIAMTGIPQAKWMPVGSFLSSILGYGPSSKFIYWTLIWVHLITFWVLAVFVLYSKHLHIFVAPFNVYFSTLKPRGQLSKMDLEEAESYGVAKIEDFTWKQLFDLYACTECGRCTRACPAWASQKPLSPKDLVVDLRRHFLSLKPEDLRGENGKRIEGDAGRPVVDEIIASNVIWSCTTCLACVEECPVFIEHIPKIVDLRRNQILSEGKAPTEIAPSLRNIEQRQNPFGLPPNERGAWAEGLKVKTLSEDSDVEYLLWVGCFGSYDERNKRVLVSLAKLLKEAGVSFGILGSEEGCCGEPARRVGDEYNFQMLAESNIEILSGYSVKKIITACPHGYNTIKNEYPQFGGEYEVYHHSEILSALLKSGKLKANGNMEANAVYHDSCYLGRYNGIYEQPRDILKSIPGVSLSEMEKHHRKSFCCGAGGGRIWMDEHSKLKVNRLRASQAGKAGADHLITACPFCLSMLEDGLKGEGLDERISAQDIAEILEKSILNNK